MSLEAKIDELIQATNRLTAAFLNNVPAAAPVAASHADAIQAAFGKAPVAPPIAQAVIPPTPPLPAPPVAAAPAMPAPPTFAPPAPVAAAVVPFTDAKGLTDYVMSTYRDLGPEKGAQIQNVLTTLGYAAVTDVQPDKYAAFHAGVEALRG